MRVPPKTEKCQETINKMVTWLHYYMGDTREFKEFVRKDIRKLEEYLNEMSEDHKIYNIRFASKLKAIWNTEVKDEIGKLKDKIKELE